MSTKAKSAAPAKTAPSDTLESRLAAALALCQGPTAEEIQLVDETPVLLEVAAPQVVQQTTTPADHLEQAAPATGLGAGSTISGAFSAPLASAFAAASGCPRR